MERRQPRKTEAFRHAGGVQAEGMMTLEDHDRYPLNRLLAHLQREDMRRLAPHLETVKLAYKQSLYRENEPIEFVYFIEDGVASLVNTMANGAASEVGTIGNEGMVGLPVLLGDSEAPTSVYMQVPGAGSRMRASSFRHALEHSAALRAVMLRYAHALFNQVAQSAACAHFHALEQRCCRWLLMTHDRMASDEFLLTHEFLAMMLGVRRAGVSQAAATLQRAGLIQYHHGRIVILDRAALEQRSCECYAVTKEEFDGLLGAAPAKADGAATRPKRGVM
ncbi:MAG TPA: Crp/Fnr family transcriptional regulator [Stellaceae bacterium]|nr:Crp/Fnr family transcriptional regulator [Stellaceae bacterium]